MFGALTEAGLDLVDGVNNSSQILQEFDSSKDSLPIAIWTSPPSFSAHEGKPYRLSVL